MSDLILEKFSIRDLVQMNPFRVLQLPVDASGPGIRKHQQKLRFDLGQSDWKGPKAICLPLVPPPSGSQIQEAFSKLDDPEERFLSELFWYWPNATGEFVFGLAAWSKWHSDESGAAGHHNIALFHFFNAIQGSIAILESEAEPGANQRGCWMEAFTGWKRLLEKEESLWHRLRARILEVGDPRLDTDIIPALRMNLIQAIEGVAIGFLSKAMKARSEKKWNMLLHHISGGNGFSAISFPRQLLEISNKELDHIDDVINAYAGKIRPITQDSKSHIDLFIEEVKSIASMLSSLENAAGVSKDLSLDISHAKTDILKKYASALRSHFIAYYNELDDLESALSWSMLIDAWSVGGIEGEKIKEDVKTLQERKGEAAQLDAALKGVQEDQAVTVQLARRSDGYTYRKVCVCCLQTTEKEGRWSSSKKEGNTQYTRTIELPHCEECQKHHTSLNGSMFKVVVIILSIIAVISYLLGRGGMAESGGLAAGLLIGCGLYFAARIGQWPAWAFSTKPLEPGHAHRGDPVKILGFDDNQTSIRFLNPLYGLQFAEMNQSKIIGPYPFTKHTRSSNILVGRTGWYVAAWVIIGGAGCGWATGEIGREYTKNENVQPRPSVQYSSPAQTATPAPSYTPPTTTYTPPALTYAPPPAPSYSYRESERARINSMKAELRQLESELNYKKSRLQGLQSSIDSSSSSLDLYRSTDNIQLYNIEVGTHNMYVNQFRSLRQEFNNDVEEYNRKLRDLNSAIDQFNANR
jgi:hypothetical protein